MQKEYNYEGKVAVVSGAGQGIGLCIAEQFLECGASVVIAEQNANLKDKAQSFLNADGQILFCVTDVSREASVRAMVNKTIRKFGRIDFLVNNAAMFVNEPIEKLTYEQWNKVIGANLSSAFLCTKYCRKHLIEQGGSIINIASTRALMSEADTEAYSATKGGLVALTHALAISLGPDVRVNCISPGWIVTDAYQHGRAKTKLTKQDHAQHPAGRVGRPEDIAKIVLYLCSEKAGFITGANFIIDGGMTKKMIYS